MDTFILILLDILYLRTELYPGDRRGGAVHRNGGAETSPGALPAARDLPAVDHHQLCGALGVAAEHKTCRIISCNPPFTALVQQPVSPRDGAVCRYP